MVLLVRPAYSNKITLVNGSRYIADPGPLLALLEPLYVLRSEPCADGGGGGEHALQLVPAAQGPQRHHPPETRWCFLVHPIIKYYVYVMLCSPLRTLYIGLGSI